jgi:hypothetical protein
VAIIVRCECGKQFQARSEDAGRRARCSVCQRELIVPQPKPSPHQDFAPLYDFGPRKRSWKAIVSLSLGLSSLGTCFLTGIPAIIFGVLGLADINNPSKRLSGKGYAISGIVLGSITTFVLVPFLALGFVQGFRGGAGRVQCTNNLKQIALAISSYESAYGCFPPAATYDAHGKPLLSWRVLLLPYLGEGTLYGQFHLDEAWDSPNNKRLAEAIPNVFRCPSAMLSHGLTSYEVVVDPSSIFTGKPKGLRIIDVTDVPRDIFLVVESSSAVSWSKPEDLSLASRDPMLGMGSHHTGGFNALMADGEIRLIKTSNMNQEMLKALVTRNGNERVILP